MECSGKNKMKWSLPGTFFFIIIISFAETYAVALLAFLEMKEMKTKQERSERERRLGSFHPVGFYGLCVYHFRFSNQRKREKRNIYLISALLAICYCISGYSGAILRSRLIIFFIFSPPQSFTRTRMVRSTNASSQSYSSGRGSTALAGV